MIHATFPENPDHCLCSCKVHDLSQLFEEDEDTDRVGCKTDYGELVGSHRELGHFM
jgi:hypothetical protein